ncbi:carbohydrate ABC transporter permease [Oerskovia sp. Sa1BUA8]|uniref:Carbohydrate ABC transporter permease n=1 Tax=Oerskovia douganii TaxID=2762210 RepID=A0A9D5UF00_9CELL|nr:carbohydrate ABC transporter permease [Oerskovia douganii]MBE7701826.1 carbohydrate ABC transporter permease [Oerskovia douganii]
MTAVTSPVEAPVPGASPGSGSGPGAGAAGRRKKKPVERFSVARTLRYALLILFVLIVLVPVYVLFVTSFKGPGDAAPTRAWNLPQVWTTENWQAAWTALAPAIGRTLQMVVPAALISAFLGSLNGFVLSRWRFRGANLVFTLILFGMFIPYQAVIIPLNQLVLSLNLPSGIPTLIVLHVIYGLPITTLIFRNYYQTVPNELIEAARVDGAGMLRTYWSIVLPISIPSFVVVLIWQFTSAWNDFLFAVFFSSSQNGPVTLALNNLANGALLQNYGVSMAGALFASLPTLVVYILLGKYFMGGLMSGSVKG